MKLVIAEKSSVAQSLAKVIGANQKKDGYLEGNGYIVSWCVGHLIELANPEHYDEKYKKWRKEDLPIFPAPFSYQVTASTKKQYQVLKELMKRSDIDSLVEATDAGREGELIFRLVYKQAGCKKPFERLWISSMEDKAIKDGFANLKPSADYDDLYEAALCRERADWLVGINATRFFSTVYGQTLNVGRVMTPTLAMIVEREAEIKGFKPENFYNVQMLVSGVAVTSKRFKHIIRAQQDEATKYEGDALDYIKRAIEEAEYYVDGEHIEIKGGDAKSKLDQALEYLVTRVYYDLDLIGKNYNDDSDIIAILTGQNPTLPGTNENSGAAQKIEGYLEMQDMKHITTKMSDIQTRYQGIPSGWREIDIAAVVALLIYEQKVTIKYGGMTIQPTDPKLPDMLRKKTEIGKTEITKRHVVSPAKMKEARDFLRDFLDVMDVPTDEDGLIAFIIERFTELENHYNGLLNKYEDKYPDKQLVRDAVRVVKDVLSQKSDNIALIDKVVTSEDMLYDMQDHLKDVESFFKTQVSLFDSASKFVESMNKDLDYISRDDEATHALNQMRLITTIFSDKKYDYKRIPEFNGLQAIVEKSHDAMLDEKRASLYEIVQSCMADIHKDANVNEETKLISDKADKFYSQQKDSIASEKSLRILDGVQVQLWGRRDEAVMAIDAAKAPKVPEKSSVTPAGGDVPPTPPKKEIIKKVARQQMFPAKVLKSDEEIDAYVENIRKQMKQYMQGSDGIQITN